MSAGNFITRNPSFFLLWLGQVCSQSGARMYQMCIIWWILGVAGESGGRMVGLFMVVAALPSLLFVKGIGRVVDTAPSKRIIVTTDFLAAILVATVSYLLGNGMLTVPLAMAAGFLAACLQALIDPTLNKSVAEVVEKRDLERGVSFLASTQSLANFSGAVLGALLIERFGTSGTALLAAAGYVVSTVATFLAKFHSTKGSSSTVAEGEGGWSILAAYPMLKRCLIGFGFVNFFATPTLVVLPVYVKRTLHAGADTLGLLEAGLWVGLLAGTFLAPAFDFVKNRIFLGGLCLVVMGACLAVPGMVTAVFVYLVALFLAGLALGVNNVKFISLFQETVEPALKGRFFALMSAVVSFSFPVSYFLFGTLADFLMPPQVCLVQGVGVVLVAVYFLKLGSQATAPMPALEGA